MTSSKRSSPDNRIGRLRPPFPSVLLTPISSAPQGRGGPWLQESCSFARSIGLSSFSVVPTAWFVHLLRHGRIISSNIVDWR